MLNLLSSGIPLNVDWRQILLHLLNLVILFVIMYFLLYNPVKKFMETRKEHYRKQDEDGAAKIAEANKLKEQYDGLIAEADAEIAEMKRTAVSNAREESERIIKSAEEEAAAILKKAYAKADEIKSRAEDEAREELSDVIAKAAEERIARACTVDGFVAENGNDR